MNMCILCVSLFMWAVVQRAKKRGLLSMLRNSTSRTMLQWHLKLGDVCTQTFRLQTFSIPALHTWNLEAPNKETD